MDDTVLERIDAAMGPNQRAAFVRDAVERELERVETTSLSLKAEQKGYLDAK